MINHSIKDPVIKRVVSDDRRLKAIDLFCGAGGLTLGLKRAGFKVIAGVEIDRLAAETYSLNHPATHLFHCDIRGLRASFVCKQLGIQSGQLDLLAGCPPCEGFSVLRTRNGSKFVRDLRNDLVFEFLRMVRALRPKVVMMENVPALLVNSRMKRFFKALDILGYSHKADIFDVATFGVPQRRRRMLLLASRIGEINFGRKARKHLVVRDFITTLPQPGKSGDPLHDVTEKRSTRVAKLIAKIPKNGGSRSSLPLNLTLTCHKWCDGYRDVYGRMALNAVAPTITSGCINPSRGRFLHPTQNRAITPREAAMLQGFPPRYLFSMRKGKFAVANLIGNALPPEFARRHAEAIRRTLEQSR